jgi:hypothetical protein
MSTENTTSDAGAQNFHSLPSTTKANTAPSSISAENEETNHDIPPVIANSTTHPPSKDGSEDFNRNKPSTHDNSQLLSDVSSEFEKEAVFYEKLANDVLQEHDDADDAENKAQRATYSSLLRIDLQQEKEKLKTRSRQAIVHLAYTEQRVKNLEAEVKRLRQDVHGLPDDFEVARPLDNPVYLHELRRAIIQDFRLNDESKIIPHHLRPALEVLLDDRGPLPISGSKRDATNNNPNGHQSPERLRIRPKALGKHIGRICGQDTATSTTAYGDTKEAPSSIVFLRPFKLFVTFETEIRASVQELEAQIEKKAAEKAADTADSKGKLQQEKHSKHKSVEYNDQDLLIDLKLLIEFLDVDLKKTFELRKKIKDGVATTIEYRDLWHLFQLGEDVIHQSTRLTVYRVINFTVRIVLQSPLTAS